LLASFPTYSNYAMDSRDRYFYHHYYDKFNEKNLVFYEPEEFEEATVDERKLGNISYEDILEKIERNEVKLEDLGLRM
jgi:hypothetical protein